MNTVPLRAVALHMTDGEVRAAGAAGSDKIGVIKALRSAMAPRLGHLPGLAETKWLVEHDARFHGVFSPSPPSQPTSVETEAASILAGWEPGYLLRVDSMARIRALLERVAGGGR